jgi:hypothetical protein
MFSSDDGGVLFDDASAGIDRNDAFAFAADPFDPETVFAATRAGVYRSRAQGAWQAMLGTAGRFTQSLATDASRRGSVYAGTTSNGLLWSDDGGEAFLLALFTTLPAADEAFQSYGKRWNIETDLRTLKSTLGLDQLTCLTPDMVAKEIDLGFVAYNLIRAFIGFASQLSGIPPRGYSFTKVRHILEVFGPALANAPDKQSAERIMSEIMRCVQQSKLPRRKRKRPSYPREVWSKGSRYPSRKK